MSDKILKTLNGYTIYDEEARTRITSIEKDYASTDYVDEAVSQPVNALADGKVDKNQGTENNGKFLGVVDGYLVLVDAPSGTSGTTDVVRCVAQELTEEQQEQVRANIGAASMTEFSALSEEIAVQQNTIEQHENQILALAQGTPPYASTTDKMTDTSKIYLGSNGNLWTYGEKESENAIEWYDQRKLSYTIGDSYDSYTSVDNYCATNLLPVSEGETITIYATGLTSDSDSCRVLYYDSAQNVSNIAVNQNASGGTWETTLTIPTGVHFIALRAFYRTSNSGWLNATITIPSIGEAGSYGWIDTGINYANYSLSDSDKDIIAQKVLDILDVSYVSLENVISIGTYTLKYDSEEITDIGVVTT